MPRPPQALRQVAGHAWARLRPQFWFKTFGITGFTTAFFIAYIHLMKHPGGPVTTVPQIWLDDWIPFNPAALPVYLSLWVYLSLPASLMTRRREIVGFGWRMAIVCLIGLLVFWQWPNAVPPSHIDWARYPGMAFLKGVDAAGNACPSLHVATAVFAGYWLHHQLPELGLGRTARGCNALWCLAICYSTMATRQHVAIDVLAGSALGLGVAWLTHPARRLAGQRHSSGAARTPASP